MNATLDQVAQQKEHTPLRALFANQPFWVTIALIVMCLVMSQVSDVFFTKDNFFNVTRNFSFIGIIALGMTMVIITRGIDLSVGSVVGLSGMVTAMIMHAGHSWWLGMGGGLLTALACGLVNGVLVAYLDLSSFIVTLGMYAVARSLAQVVSQNHMIDEVDAHEHAGRFQPPRQFLILRARGGIARRMVVEGDEGGGAGDQRLAEDVARLDDRRVERSGRHDCRFQDSMFRIEEHDAELLDRARAIRGHQIGCGIARRPQLNPGAGGAGQRPPAEFERGHQLRRLRCADPADARQIGGSRSHQAVHATAGVQ